MRSQLATLFCRSLSSIYPTIDTRIRPSSPGDRRLYLTFDDGPHPQGTDALLDVLARYHATATFFLVALRALLKARRGPVVTGHEQLMGSVGEALEDFDVSGRIRVHSEMWTARTKTPMQRGTRVRVIGIDGLTLSIEPFEEKTP